MGIGNGHRKWGIGSGASEMEHRKWGIGNGALGMGHLERGLEMGHLGMGHLGMGRWKWGIGILVVKRSFNNSNELHLAQLI
jgi:hypothetical protein